MSTTPVKLPPKSSTSRAARTGSTCSPTSTATPSSASMRSSPMTWRCFAGTASTPSARRSPPHRTTRARPRTPTATSCCGSSSPAARVTSDQLRTIGKLSERYGRSMGDITTRQNIQLHWLAIEDMPVILDELNAAGLSFTQACGDVWRNIVGLPARRRRRPRAAGLTPGDRGARAHVRRRPPVLEPAAQVQGVGVRLHPRLRAARDQRPGASWRSRRTARSATTCGSAVASAPRRTSAAGSTSFVPRRRRGRDLRRRSPRSTATRESAPSAPAPASSSSSTSGAPSGCATRWRPSSAIRCALGRPAGADRSAPRPPRHPPAGAARPLLHRRDDAARPLHGRPDDRCRRRRRPVRLGRDPLHQPPEPDRAGRARRPGRRGRCIAGRSRPADRGVDLPPRASSRARACSSASSRSSRPRIAPSELIDHLERRVGDVAGSLRINLNGCPNACAQYQVADIGLQGGIAKLEDGTRAQGFILHIGGHLGPDAGFGRQGLEQGDAGRRHEVRRRADRAGLCGRARGGRHLLGLGAQQTDVRLAGLPACPSAVSARPRRSPESPRPLTRPFGALDYHGELVAVRPG